MQAKKEPAPQATKDASIVPSFDWAVNVVKLNRAKAYVQALVPAVEPKDVEATVKARYTQIGGLLKEDKIETPAQGKVVNLAENDED